LDVARDDPAEVAPEGVAPTLFCARVPDGVALALFCAIVPHDSARKERPKVVIPAIRRKLRRSTRDLAVLV
jgi:hypothetical protein